MNQFRLESGRAGGGGGAATGGGVCSARAPDAAGPLSHLDFGGGITAAGAGTGEDGRIRLAAEGWFRIVIRSAVTLTLPPFGGRGSLSWDIRLAEMDEASWSGSKGRLDGEGPTASVGVGATGGGGMGTTTGGGGGGGGGARYDSGDTRGPVGTALDLWPNPRSTREISSIPM